MVAMYHSGTSPSIQDHVLQSLKDPIGKVRIVIATNALGMGVDIKGLHHVINYGPPPDLESYVQEMGRAGRDNAYSEQHYAFMEDNFVSVNQRCWNTQSQSPVKEGKFLIFKSYKSRENIYS